MAEILHIIKAPIAQEMQEFDQIFRESLSHTDGLLDQVLKHIMNRGGKRMRPILTLLIAKALSSEETRTNDYYKALHAACSLELLHTASLVHDDVVDESDQRRGQKSVNASYTNRIAILVGDYILSTSLRETALTRDPEMTAVLSRLGQVLSEGEVRQIQNISNMEFSMDNYFDIISKKTAVLFEACCHLGGLSVGATEEQINAAREFGKNLGIIFQIRDDIFDYYDSKEIGKPTGNDMREGKLTLPVLHVLNNVRDEHAIELATKVKKQSASDDEIGELIALTKQLGGIEYAREVMEDYYRKSVAYLNDTNMQDALRQSLTTYLDYVIGREF